MYRSLLVVLMGLLVCSPGFAAEGEESAVVMDEIVVTAGRVEETVQEQTMNVTVISSEEIEDSSSRDLGDLLAEKGIGYIHKYPGALTTASIRGFKTNAQQSDLLGYSLVLINGRRAGTGNLAMIMTNDIEKVEIIRGPGAVQYGSAAMGGVINVITRQGAGPLDAEVFGTLGSFGLKEGGFLVSGDTENFDYSLGFSSSTMDDYRTARNGKYQNTGFDAKQSYSLGFGYRFTESQRVGITLNTTEISKAGTPSLLIYNDLDDYRDSDYQAIDLTYEGETIDQRMSWSARLFTTEIEDISFDQVASNPGPYFGDDGLPYVSVVDQQGLQAQVSRKTGPVNSVFGIDWYDYEVESTYSPNRSTFENVAGFLLLKGEFLNEKLIVDAGLRYDKAEVEMVDPKGNTEKHDNLVKSFGLAYLINDSLKIRVHYGEAFKMPGADQLAADYLEDFGEYGQYQYSGNPDLDPESSKTSEVGLEFANQTYSANLGYFYTRLKDKITKISDYSVDPYFVTWANVGKSEISGIEVDLAADFILLGSDDIRLKPYLNLTYLDRYRDLDNDKDLMYMNDMNASYGFNLKLPQELSARLNFSYHGSKVVEDWENDPYGGADVKLGGFTVVDLGVTKQFIDASCSLSFKVSNLFDKDYAFIKGYHMPGRNYQLSLKHRF